MHLKSKLVVGALGLVSLCSQAFATDARVESMGKNSNFIMDDISIYDNPANVGIYPNYLIGEMGTYQMNPPEGSNVDPQNPYFGGIFSIGLGEDKMRDPRFSIGGALNRHDPILKFLPSKVVVPNELRSSERDTVEVPTPVTNFDGFLGLSTQNGDLFGLHIYTALQDGMEDNGTVNHRAYSSVLLLDGGVNFQLNEDVDWEISGGLSRIDFGENSDDFFDPSLMGFFGKMRMFSTLEAINGELVPHGELRYTTMEGRNQTYFTLGMGVNVAMDRGFFWLGVEYFSEEDETETWTTNNQGEVIVIQHPEVIGENSKGMHHRVETGATISFGIERNIWWDWFVVRVGGKKTVSYIECNWPDIGRPLTGICGEEGEYFNTNPVGDGTEDDHVGFGIGVNIEEKLKVDLTMAEDILYRNPFQGYGRLISRLSATYAF